MLFRNIAASLIGILPTLLFTFTLQVVPARAAEAATASLELQLSEQVSAGGEYGPFSRTQLIDLTTGASVPIYAKTDTTRQYSGLTAGRPYLIYTAPQQYREYRKVLIPATKHTVHEVLFEEWGISRPEALLVHEPQGSSSTVFGRNTPITVSASVWLDKPGILKAFLINHVTKTVKYLGATAFTPPSDGKNQTIYFTPVPVGDTIAPGAGYYVKVTYLSTDGRETREATSYSVFTVSGSDTTLPKIQRMTGPSTVYVGEPATWKVTASRASKQSSTHYGINFGVGKQFNKASPQSASSIRLTGAADSSASFTTTYFVPGTYTVQGYIKSPNNGFAVATRTVHVKVRAKNQKATSTDFVLLPGLLSQYSSDTDASVNVRVYASRQTPLAAYPMIRVALTEEDTVSRTTKVLVSKDVKVTKIGTKETDTQGNVVNAYIGFATLTVPFDKSLNRARWLQSSKKLRFAVTGAIDADNLVAEPFENNNAFSIPISLEEKG